MTVINRYGSMVEVENADGTRSLIRQTAAMTDLQLSQVDLDARRPLATAAVGVGKGPIQWNAIQ